MELIMHFFMYLDEEHAAGAQACETLLTSEEDHLAPDPEDCHSFYMCQPAPGGGWLPFHVTCPNDLAFNDEGNR